MEVEVELPRPEVRGEGRVLYRCATCGDQMEPDDAVIIAGLSYHPEHTPEKTDGQ